MEIETIIQSAFDKNGNEKPGYAGFKKYLKELGVNKIMLQPKQNRITFENVSSNIICSRITGNRQLLDLTLKITPENSELCDIAYRKSGKLKVTIEVME